MKVTVSVGLLVAICASVYWLTTEYHYINNLNEGLEQLDGRLDRKCKRLEDDIKLLEERIFELEKNDDE